MTAARYVFSSLVAVFCLAGLFRAAAAGTTPAGATAAAGPATTTAPSTVMKNLKKLEECAGGPRALEEESIGTFNPQDLASPRAFRRAAARQLAKLAVMAMRCAAPHVFTVIAVTFRLLFITAKCIVTSMGSITVMGGCMAINGARVTFPLIIVSFKISVCILKKLAEKPKPGGATTTPEPEELLDFTTSDDRRHRHH